MILNLLSNLVAQFSTPFSNLSRVLSVSISPLVYQLTALFQRFEKGLDCNIKSFLQTAKMIGGWFLCYVWF